MSAVHTVLVIPGNHLGKGKKKTLKLLFLIVQKKIFAPHLVEMRKITFSWVKGAAVPSRMPLKSGHPSTGDGIVGCPSPGKGSVPLRPCVQTEK